MAALTSSPATASRTRGLGGAPANCERIYRGTYRIRFAFGFTIRAGSSADAGFALTERRAPGEESRPRFAVGSSPRRIRCGGWEHNELIEEGKHRPIGMDHGEEVRRESALDRPRRSRTNARMRPRTLSPEVSLTVAHTSSASVGFSSVVKSRRSRRVQSPRHKCAGRAATTSA